MASMHAVLTKRMAEGKRWGLSTRSFMAWARGTPLSRSWRKRRRDMLVRAVSIAELRAIKKRHSTATKSAIQLSGSKNLEYSYYAGDRGSGVRGQKTMDHGRWTMDDGPRGYATLGPDVRSVVHRLWSLHP